MEDYIKKIHFEPDLSNNTCSISIDSYNFVQIVNKINAIIKFRLTQITMCNNKPHIFKGLGSSGVK